MGVFKKKCNKPNDFSDVEQIRFKAVKLITKYSMYLICSHQQKSNLGVKINQPYKDINRLLLFIDLMTIVYNEIQLIIKLNGCVSKEDLAKIYKKYDVKCIIDKNDCQLPQDYFNQIFNLFKPVRNLCETEYTYKWINGECEQLPIELEWLWSDSNTDCLQQLPPFPYILLETGDYILQEDTNRIYING